MLVSCVTLVLNGGAASGLTVCDHYALVVVVLIVPLIVAVACLRLRWWFWSSSARVLRRRDDACDAGFDDDAFLCLEVEDDACVAAAQGGLVVQGEV